MAAVPFTLTLDLDFASLDNHESFKADVLKDLAAAAGVDTRFLRVAALRAGSVIIEVLCALGVRV